MNAPCANGSRPPDGFTAIELTMSLLAAAILALTAALLIGYGYAAWRQNLQIAAAQREVSNTMDAICRIVHTSSASRVAALLDPTNGTFRVQDGCLYYTAPNGEQTLYESRFHGYEVLAFDTAVTAQTAVLRMTVTNRVSGLALRPERIAAWRN